MEYIAAIIYTLGQGLCFNVVLPVWYILIQLSQMM